MKQIFTQLKSEIRKSQQLTGEVTDINLEANKLAVSMVLH